MLNATTTYRDDYNSPSVKYFPIPHISFRADAQSPNSPQQCICDDKIEEKSHEYNSYEWSRLGPMGLLLEPKLYGVKTNVNICSDEKLKYVDNKNWMKNLRESSNLKKVASPYHDMLRMVQEDRLKSTYNIDYDHDVEYPNICYDEEFPSYPEVREEIKCRELTVKPPWIGGHDLPGMKPRSGGFPPVPELPVKIASERPKIAQSSKPKNPKIPKSKAPASSKLKGPQKGKEPARMKKNVRSYEKKQEDNKTTKNMQMDPVQEKDEKSVPKNYQGNLNHQQPVKKPWTTTYCEVYCRPANEIMKDECFCRAEKEDDNKK